MDEFIDALQRLRNAIENLGVPSEGLEIYHPYARTIVIKITDTSMLCADKARHLPEGAEGIIMGVPIRRSQYTNVTKDR